MKKPTNIKELCEFMWYLENKYDLINFEISGVKPWQAHRIEIYYEIGRLSGVFEKNLKRGMNKIEKIKSVKNLFLNAIKYNPLLNLKKVDYLIFSHPRSKKVDEEFIDIYSHYFINDLLKNGDKFIEFENIFEGKHLRKYRPYKRYLDFINIIREMSKYKRLTLSNKEKNILDSIGDEISKTLNVSYNIKKVLINRVKKFSITYSIYKKILQKTQPKQIIVVVSYGRAELIKASKDLGIKTIELQHGTFSKYHLGYSYPNKTNLDYFPDEFWVWNEYWKDLIEFPIDKKNIKIYPFKYLEYEKSKYNLTKNKNQMVILGQGGLTDRMAKKILDNFEFFEKFDLIFKLHPEEYSRSDLYENLVKLQNKKNIKIVEDVDLYQLLASSEYQGGVFSTALYEGVEFGCKTILFDLPGIEYMEKFIKLYKAKII